MSRTLHRRHSHDGLLDISQIRQQLQRSNSNSPSRKTRKSIKTEDRTDRFLSSSHDTQRTTSSPTSMSILGAGGGGSIASSSTSHVVRRGGRRRPSRHHTQPLHQASPTLHKQQGHHSGAPSHHHRSNAAADKIVKMARLPYLVTRSLQRALVLFVVFVGCTAFGSYMFQQFLQQHDDSIRENLRREEFAPLSERMVERVQTLERDRSRLRKRLKQVEADRLQLATAATTDAAKTTTRSPSSALAAASIPHVQDHLHSLERHVLSYQSSVQKMSRARLLERFGPGPHRVELQVVFPPDVLTPDTYVLKQTTQAVGSARIQWTTTAEQSTQGDEPSNIGAFVTVPVYRIVVELAPYQEMPHATHWFLEQVSRGLYDGTAFHMNAPHIVVGGPVASGLVILSGEPENQNSDKILSSSTAQLYQRFADASFESLLVPEYHDRWSHAKYTIGYMGQPSGPDFYFNMRNNADIHGPPLKPRHHAANDSTSWSITDSWEGSSATTAEPCFGAVVEGRDVVDQLHALPTKQADNGSTPYELRYKPSIVRMQLLSPECKLTICKESLVAVLLTWQTNQSSQPRCCKSELDLSHLIPTLQPTMADKSAHDDHEPFLACYVPPSDDAIWVAKDPSTENAWLNDDMRVELSLHQQVAKAGVSNRACDVKSLLQQHLYHLVRPHRNFCNIYQLQQFVCEFLGPFGLTTRTEFCIEKDSENCDRGVLKIWTSETEEQSDGEEKQRSMLAIVHTSFLKRRDHTSLPDIKRPVNVVSIAFTDDNSREHHRSDKTFADEEQLRPTKKRCVEPRAANERRQKKAAALCSLRAQVIPGESRRTDFPLVPEKAALLVIDIQRLVSEPPTGQTSLATNDFYRQTLPSAMDRIATLASAFRSLRDQLDDDGPRVSSPGCEVIFTFIQAATRDGRDISLDYKLSGPGLALQIPTISTPRDEIFVKSCAPNDRIGKGDILLPKTACSVFNSTNLHYLLQNLGVEQLVVTGVVTDQCVESAIRDAADLGYLVTVVEDACAAHSTEQHAKGLQGVAGFSRRCTSVQILKELQQAQANEVPQSAEKLIDEDNERHLNNDVVLNYLKSRGLTETANHLRKELDRATKF